MHAGVLNGVTSDNRPECTCSDCHCVAHTGYFSDHVIGDIFGQISPTFNISDRPGNAHDEHGNRTPDGHVTPGRRENEEYKKPSPHLDRQPAFPNKPQYEF
jgi:hypothetical protein